ncbi:MAG: PEP-CTERM sorting domain-containing protein [Phycisphaerales bacterium]|nr:PEP-CTERM sorting domain-containing protein [Phycisphaerales bacterium]MCB9855680.1 PEP-CTERM sorting domain-containing protein [Phycisphaerales bacterium]MCB9862575.1 PEP-CTERM sorting domain-containing protein [Phycisphaerales bacterium]
MKKNFAITAALAAMFAMPAFSMGAAQIWWTLDSGDASQVSGGVGQTLVLNRGDAAQIYDFTVTMWANVTNVGLFSANTTLTANGAVSATAAALNAPPGGGVTPAGGLNTPGPGPIATNFGGATFSGTGYLGNMINLGTISLRIDNTGGAVGNVDIFAQVGSGVFGQSDFQAATVDYGPNLGIDGGVEGNGAGGLPVITIIQVPEPATLSLIGLGALALIRRRR